MNKKLTELKNELRETRYYYKYLETPYNKDDYKSLELYEIDCKYRSECLEGKKSSIKSIKNKIRYYTKKYNKELERLNETLKTNEYELE
jgi:hypothetical protein